jgi:hypothetical protein
MIPDNVIPATVVLIEDCLAIDYSMRSSFIEILCWIKAIGLKQGANPRSAAIADHV